MTISGRLRFARSPSVAIAVCAAAAWLGGCSKSGTKEVVAAENSNLKPLSVLYGQYQSANQNRPPASEAEFKKFIQGRGESLLTQFETDLDGLFVSKRDGQPYVVFYRGSKPPPSGVVAYEREGVGGERIVAYPYGAVGVVDEIRFRELVPDAP